MRWFFGDLHGCARSLERLLESIRFDSARDELWSVGDLVNTGPDPAEALRLWIASGGRGVLGNHDIHALRVRSGARKLRDEDRLSGLLAAPDAGELFDALRSLPLLAFLPGEDGARDVWLVHAGLHPAWDDPHEVARRFDGISRDETGWKDPKVRFATRARCCTKRGKMLDDPGPPQVCSGPYRPWDDFYKGKALVVHGHWARRGHYRGRRTLGLDSGCVYGGPLTAWCQEEDRVVAIR